MKNNYKIIISCIGLVCFVIFNILFFLLISSNMGAGKWVLYVILDIAILCAVVLPWLIKEKKQTSAENDIRLKEISFIKTNSLKLKSVAQNCSDKELSCKIENLYNRLHASQSASCKAAEDTEKEITESISQLENAVLASDAQKANQHIKGLGRLLTERENILFTDNINLKEDM